MRNSKKSWLLVAIALTSVFATSCRSCVRNSPAVMAAGKPQLVVGLGHSEAINSSAFSPNGKLLASGSADKTIKLWDVATSAEIRTFKGHDAGVAPVVFSPDSKILASGGGDKTIKLWDVITGTEIRTLKVRTIQIESLSFSPDGKTLICESFGDDKIKLWDVATGTEIRVRAGGSDLMAVSPDGKTLVSQIVGEGVWIREGMEGIKLWDAATGLETHTLRGHNDVVKSAIFSRDGKALASGSEKDIKLWDVATGKELGTLERGLELIALSPDGKLIVSIDEDNTIWWWEVATRREFRLPEGNSKPVAFSPDGRMLACASPHGIRLWDVVNGKELSTIKDWFGVIFSPDSKTLLAEFTDRIKLLDIASGTVKTLRGYGAEVDSTSFSPDGKTLAVSANSANNLRLWDVTTGKELHAPKTSLGAGSAAFSPDSKTLAFHGMLWDIAAGEEKSTFWEYWKRHIFRSVAFSPDGKTLVTVEQVPLSPGRGHVVLWDVDKGSQLRTLENESGFDECSVAFNPNGKMLAIGCSRYVSTERDSSLDFSRKTSVETTVNLWDATGNELHALTLDMYVNSLAFSPDGKALAFGGSKGGEDSNTIRLWDVATDTKPHALSVNLTVNSLAFSPDGKTLAGGSDDGTILLWDIATDTELRGFKRHTGGVNSVAFSPDGRNLVSGSKDGSARLWDVATGAELASIIVFGGGGWVIATPDGRFDASRIDDIKGLHWLMPDAPLTPLPIEIFMRDYYEPKLLPRVLAREKFKPVRDFSTLNRTQPEVKIVGSEKDSAWTLEVTVQVANVKSTVQQDAEGNPLESGVFDVRLFRDGQLVGYAPPNDGEVKLDADGKATLKFPNIKWPYMGVGEVEFSAYAFNADRIKSATFRGTGTVTPIPPPIKGRVYAISLGVNAYEREGLNLRYAANDARQMQETLSKRLAAQGEYQEVVSVPLVSDYAVALPDGRTVAAQDATLEQVRARQKRITENRATKAHLRAVLDVLAGRQADAALLKDIPNADKLRAARPEDLVLISASSHGYTDSDGIFYLVPSDTGTAPLASPEFRSRCISSDELSRWLRDVDAGELVMIVDACHSAAAVEGTDFKPGPMGSRGLGQLSYDKGMRILTATQADNVALEANRVRQGLLIYALIEDGLASWLADYKPRDKSILLTEWLGYGVERVPRLYEEMKGGRIRGTFDPRELENDKTQQPSLFDFARRRREVVLARQP